MSLTDVPDDQLAAVVTYLEMRTPASALDIPPSPLSLHRVGLSPQGYRTLFGAVGAPWLWFSRLLLSDPELRAIIDHAQVELYEVRVGAIVVGMLELDRRATHEGKPACELSFVGLIPSYAGQGHGRWLIAEAVARAWQGAAHLHVHTCSLDHPAALAAYRRAGFVAVARKVETFIDPRLAGILPRDAAPHIPLLGRLLNEPSS